MNKQKFILLAAQKDAKTNEPAEEDIYRVGTLGTVVQLLRLPDGTVKVLVEGKQRARVARYRRPRRLLPRRGRRRSRRSATRRPRSRR